MKVVIADDERLARERLTRMVAACGHEVVGEAQDGKSLERLLGQVMPDVVLLDIQMPGEDGVAWGERLAAISLPPAVIYVTAHAEYALRAFATHAVDYLLKPVSLERLCKALEAAARPNRAQLVAQAQGRQLTVRVGRELRVLPLESVLLFEAGDKYVTALTRAGEFVLEQSLRQLESWVGPGFLRVHRSMLLAASVIERLETGEDGRHWLSLRGLNRKVEVSRRQLKVVKAWFAAQVGTHD